MNTTLCSDNTVLPIVCLLHINFFICQIQCAEQISIDLG